MCNWFCVHWELQVDETRKRLEYREKHNKPQQPYAKAMIWLIYTEISFHIQEDKSQFRGGGKGKKITGEKIIPELNMCQSSHYYIHDKYTMLALTTLVLIGISSLSEKKKKKEMLSSLKFPLLPTSPLCTSAPHTELP